MPRQSEKGARFRMQPLPRLRRGQEAGGVGRTVGDVRNVPRRHISFSPYPLLAEPRPYLATRVRGPLDQRHARVPKAQPEVRWYRGIVPIEAPWASY